MDWKIAVRYRFRLQKLKRPIVVKNVDGMNNSVKAIIYQVKVDMYYKSYIERMRMDVYNLRRINIILEMLWFQIYNLETNWKIEEVKIIRYLPLYGRNMKLKEEKREKKEKRIVTLEEEKIVR